ncbi:hypothetical protein BC827DRAFT_1251429 [Russula dissimulans]|nr:hypothetical protein BC827DRAFT_1251429 [Russula dissimulans]
MYPEKEKFLPLLEAVLHDVTPSTSPSAESTGSLTPLGSLAFPLVPIATPSRIPPRGDPDYVWDVFYHRSGLLNDRDAAANVATLTGLPESLADAYASASESEEDDEADEDSNDARLVQPEPFNCTAEEYYKDDYPDEESPGYDLSGNDDDLNWYDDHDWR